MVEVRGAPATSLETTGHSGTSRPSRVSTRSAAAVRSGCPGPRRASSTGVASASAYAVMSVATSGAGGLETSTISSTAGSSSRRRRASRVASPPTSAERSRPPTPSAEETPTPAWSSRASSCWQPVPDAATMPTGPGRHHVGEAEPDAVDDRGPAVGAHDQDPAVGGRALERDLLGHRHVVAEDHHVAAGVDRVHRLGQHVGSGDGDQHDRVGRLAEGGRGRPWRLHLRRARGSSGRLGERLGDAGEGGVQPVRVVEPQRDDEVVGRGLGRDVEAHPGQHLEVQLGGHRDLGGGDARQALDGAADLQQRHRVGERSRPELDVGRHAAPAPIPRPAGDRLPRCARWRAGRRSPAPREACRARAT